MNEHRALFSRESDVLMKLTKLIEIGSSRCKLKSYHMHESDKFNLILCGETEMVSGDEAP